MNQEELIKKLMDQVMQSLGNDAPKFDKKPESSPAPRSSAGSSTPSYPLSENMGDQIKSASGKVLSSFTLDKVLSGELKAEDFRIAPETLELQAQVAEASNRPQLANNMRRASELIAVPDDELLDAYNALRPYRKSKQELLDLADRLEKQYNCTESAQFIRDAANVYEKRGRLAREDDE